MAVMLVECTDYQVRVHGEWETHAWNLTATEIDRLRASVPAHWREGSEYRFATEVYDLAAPTDSGPAKVRYTVARGADLLPLVTLHNQLAESDPEHSYELVRIDGGREYVIYTSNPETRPLHGAGSAQRTGPRS